MTKIKEIENLDLIERANEFVPVDDLQATNKQDAIVEVYESAVKSDVVNRVEIVTENPVEELPGVLYIKIGDGSSPSPSPITGEVDPVFTSSPAYGITSQNIAYWNGKADTGDRTYVFENTETASDTWVINHNLNKYPCVSVVDSSGTEVVGQITYNNINKLTITFKGAFKGKAYLN